MGKKSRRARQTATCDVVDQAQVLETLSAHWDETPEFVRNALMDEQIGGALGAGLLVPLRLQEHYEMRVALGFVERDATLAREYLHVPEDDESAVYEWPNLRDVRGRHA